MTCILSFGPKFEVGMTGAVTGGRGAGVSGTGGTMGSWDSGRLGLLDEESSERGDTGGTDWLWRWKCDGIEELV